MSISKKQSKAINEFFQAVERLRKSGVIRSDRFLGDVGEFLVASQYDLELAESGRQKGHDTKGDTDKVQIKLHNSPTRTNLSLGDPSKYDRVIAVVGPDSLLHPGGTHAGKYCFYEFSAKIVMKKFKTPKSYSCGKQALSNPNKTLAL